MPEDKSGPRKVQDERRTTGFTWSSVLTNRLGVKVDCFGIVFRLERFVTLLLYLLGGWWCGFFGQRFGKGRIRIIDRLAIRMIWRFRRISSAGKGGQDGDGRQRRLPAYRSIGDSLFVAAAGDEVEGELAMFF